MKRFRHLNLFVKIIFKEKSRKWMTAKLTIVLYFSIRFSYNDIYLKIS